MNGPNGTVDWSAELKDLIGASKTAEDRKAAQAFAKAIGPYLDNPALLRTLLGKIQAPMPDDSVRIIVGERTFKSIEDVKARISHDVDVITL